LTDRRWKLKSQWLEPSDAIPEMELSDFVRLCKEHLAILSEPGDPPYWVRFIGSPYNPFVDGCASIRVMAHHKGTRVSPLVIKAVLEKFEITDERFREAYNLFFSQVPRAASTEQPSTKPN
jgi:hypothetical protein